MIRRSPHNEPTAGDPEPLCTRCGRSLDPQGVAPLGHLLLAPTSLLCGDCAALLVDLLEGAPPDDELPW